MNIVYTLPIQHANGSYPIFIGYGFETGVNRLLQKVGWSPATPTMIITDQHVAELSWFQRLAACLKDTCEKCIVAIVPPGEQAKELQFAAQLYDQAFAAGLDRDAWILAVGGGVVGDLAGFVAATYMRGINFVQIPTTLLAHDSSIGGKVAVNHPRGKNIIGAFHQPRAVLFDVLSLMSLSDREFRSGLAEVVKHALIADANLWDWLQANQSLIQDRNVDTLIELLHQSCGVKARIVQEDEREQHVRALLNFGHTFGHAFETLLGYGTLTHGEAVSIGMVAALELGAQLGYHSPELRSTVEAVFSALNLPIRLPVNLSEDEAIESMRRDKKAKRDRLTFVLLNSIGSAKVVRDVPIEPVRKALQVVQKGE
jgi:3-dehydroquinate synthase